MKQFLNNYLIVLANKGKKTIPDRISRQASAFRKPAHGKKREFRLRHANSHTSPPTKNGTLHGETHTDSLLFLIVVISLAMAKAQLIPKIMFNAKEQ